MVKQEQQTATLPDLIKPVLGAVEYHLKKKKVFFEQSAPKTGQTFNKPLIDITLFINKLLPCQAPYGVNTFPFSRRQLSKD